MILATFQSFGINPVTGTEDNSALRINRVALREEAQLIPIPQDAGNKSKLFTDSPSSLPLLSQQPACRRAVIPGGDVQPLALPLLGKRPRGVSPCESRDADPVSRTGPTS